MNKADYILLIVEHLVNQGVEDADQFAEYLVDLQTMSMQDLADQLEIVERLVV
jgi:hypothetical protein